MLWLLDRAGAQTAYIRNLTAAVMTRRYRDHSEVAMQLPVSAFSKALAAYFALVQGDPTVYLAEHVELKKQKKRGSYVDVRGREATALLHTRIIEGTFTWAGATPGQMIKDVLDSFTGARAIPLIFGTGETLGEPMSMQRSNEDAGKVVFEILAASGLGMRTRMVGNVAVLDVYDPGEMTALLGDKHGSGSSGKFVKSIAAWKNYAIVLGQGVGDARKRIDVDLTGGTEERRELLVDADDISPDGLTDVELDAALATRGREKLEKQRRIEYGEADVDKLLSTGDTVYYDSGLWAAEMLVTEVEEVRERGKKRRYAATLGWREPDINQSIERVAAGAQNVTGGNVHVVGATGEPAFASSWTAVTGRAPHFARLPGGLVIVEGAVKTGTLGAKAFTLPEGFRPPTTRSFSIIDNAGAAMYVRVDSNGDVVPVSGNTAAIALDGISFLAA